MTKAEFDLMPSFSNAVCPECGVYSTEPQPNCACRIMYGQHVMRFHHVCKKKDIDFVQEQMKEKK